MTGGIQQMALSTIRTTIGTQTNMMMHLTTRNTKNIMSTTPRNTIMAYMEEAHEHDQEHTQEGASAGSEDDYQDE